MTTFTDSLRENFNGDGFGLASFGDLFLFDSQGHNAIWLMHNNQFFSGSNLPSTATSWHIRAAADFDDGGASFSDILWQNDNGLVALWQMDGTNIVTQQNLQNVGPNWHANFANDFDGNQAADILFQHDNGMLAIWTFASGANGGANGTSVIGQFNIMQNPGPAWNVVGVRDMNSDGRADVVLQNNKSAVKFPSIREKNREFRKFKG